MIENTLYMIGLILAILYLIMGFDDFIWDFYSFTKRATYRKSRLDFKELTSKVISNNNWSVE